MADTNLLRKLVQLINPAKSESILEIGSGGGALTEILAPFVTDLIGVEIDSRLYKKLSLRSDLPNCKFLNKNILKLDINNLVFETKNIRVVGNLPYNISSQILFLFVEADPFWSDCHFMVQKEVGERIIASAGSKIYGRLSVNIQSIANVRKILNVPSEVFVPKPKVESVVVRVTPLFDDFLTKREVAILRKISRLAFGQRRKMLRNSLASLNIDNSLFDLSQRPEKVEVVQFKQLARWVASR